MPVTTATSPSPIPGNDWTATPANPAADLSAGDNPPTATAPDQGAPTGTPAPAQKEQARRPAAGPARRPVPWTRRLRRILLGPPRRRPAKRQVRPTAAQPAQPVAAQPARPAAETATRVKPARRERPAPQFDIQKMSLCLAGVMVIPAVPAVVKAVVVLVSALSAVATATGMLVPAGVLLWASRHPDKVKETGRRIRRFNFRGWFTELCSEPSSAERPRSGETQ